MHWTRFILKFLGETLYDAVAAEINALTLPVEVPGIDIIKTELLAKVHAILVP